MYRIDPDRLASFAEMLNKQSHILSASTEAASDRGNTEESKAHKLIPNNVSFLLLNKLFEFNTFLSIKPPPRPPGPLPRSFSLK